MLCSGEWLSPTFLYHPQQLLQEWETEWIPGTWCNSSLVLALCQPLSEKSTDPGNKIFPGGFSWLFHRGYVGKWSEARRAVSSCDWQEKIHSLQSQLHLRQSFRSWRHLRRPRTKSAWMNPGSHFMAINHHKSACICIYMSCKLLWKWVCIWLYVYIYIYVCVCVHMYV